MSLQTLAGCCFYVGLVILPCAGQTSRFTSTLYGGKTVTGLVGSSVSFSWSFFGALDGIDTIDWGLKSDGVSNLATVLVTIKVSSGGPIPVSIPPDYSGSVTGNFTGTKFSGQVIFTLSSIKTSYKGYYGCRLNPVSDFDSSQFDYVYLAVEGPPSVTHISANQTVNEGHILSLNCTAVGNPTPTITWTRLSDNSVVTMPLNISRRSDGGYKCTADNQIGIAATADVFVIVRYKPTIKTAVTSAAKSWIGQTVQLTCEADGRPTPTITWEKQDGSKVKEVTATRNIASVEMKAEGDFGTYTCEAKNTVGPAVAQTVQIKQIKAPGSPIITSAAEDIQATLLTVKWNAPTTNGGSPITAYRVVLVRGGHVIRNENFTDLNLQKEKLIGSLNRSTNYTVRVHARNFVFEGKAGEKMIRTKFQGVPDAPEILGLPEETNNTQITLKWSEPADNGKPIKYYTVYQISVITDLSVLQVPVHLGKEKVYEFVVTATNEFGESFKEEKKLKKITFVGGVPSAVKLKAEQNDDKITLTWEKPDGNGAAITKYSVYHRVANAKEWEDPIDITAGSKLEYVFE